MMTMNNPHLFLLFLLLLLLLQLLLFLLLLLLLLQEVAENVFEHQKDLVLKNASQLKEERHQGKNIYK
jgi:hypothetical protein